MSRLKYKGSRRAIKRIGRTYKSESGTGTATRRTLVCGFLLLLGVRAAPALDISGDHRLIGRFVEDAAVVQKAWFGITGQYSNPSGGRDILATIDLAFRVGHDVEVGARAGLIDRRRNAGEVLFGTPLASSIDSAGVADLLVFGKYRVLRGPFEMALGASASLPLAAEERGLGPGSPQASGFAAFRKSFRPATMVFSAGATDRSDAGRPGRARGRVAAIAGAGVLVPLSYDWTFLGELNYDGARYQGDHSATRCLAGLDWRPTPNIVFRGSIARGFQDGTPPTTAVLSAAFRY